MKARTQACFHTKHCCLTLFFSMTRAESRLQKPSDEWVVFHSFTHSFNTLYFWCRASVTWPNVPRPALWESIRVRWNCALQVLECSCIHHPAMYAKHHLWESWEIGACDHIKSCNLCNVTSDKKLQLLKIYKKVILAEENRRRKEKTKPWEENAVGPAPFLGMSTPPCSEVKLRFAMFYSARQATPFSLFISP